MRGRLEQQRGFADAWFPADEYQRSGNDAASKDAVELANPRREPLGNDGVDVGVELRSGRPRERVSFFGRTGDNSRRHRPFLDRKHRLTRIAVEHEDEALLRRLDQHVTLGAADLDRRQGRLCRNVVIGGRAAGFLRIGRESAGHQGRAVVEDRRCGMHAADERPLAAADQCHTQLTVERCVRAHVSGS